MTANQPLTIKPNGSTEFMGAGFCFLIALGVVTWGGALLALIPGGIGLLLLVRGATKPARYELGSRGIKYFGSKTVELPWTEISDVRKHRFEKRIYVSFKISHPSSYEYQFTKADRLLPAGAESEGVSPLSLNMTGTNASPEEVINFARKRFSPTARKAA